MSINRSLFKEGNCFTGGNDFQALNRIAKTFVER
jgi:hypothetical protein